MISKGVLFQDTKSTLPTTRPFGRNKANGFGYNPAKTSSLEATDQIKSYQAAQKLSELADKS